MKKSFDEIIENIKNNPGEKSLSNMLKYFEEESLRIFAPIILKPSEEDFLQMVSLRRGEAITAVHDMEFNVDTIKLEDDDAEYLYCFTKNDHIPENFKGIPLQSMYLDEFLSICYAVDSFNGYSVIIDPLLPGQMLCNKDLSEFILKTKQQSQEISFYCHPARNKNLEENVKEQLNKFPDIISAYIAEVDQIGSNHFIILLETFDNADNDSAVRTILENAKKLTDPIMLTVSYISKEEIDEISKDRRPVKFFQKMLS